MSEEERTLVVLPVAASPDAPIQGSIIIECMRCHVPAWLSPTGQKHILLASSVICTRCALREVEAHPEEDHVVEVLPGAIEELEAELERERKGERK